MMKKRANRDELFEADEHSGSWAEHQVWRIQRLMNLESVRLSIPESSLRLAYESRQIMELISRSGDKVSYRADGIVDAIIAPSKSNQTMTFLVSWIDPWGYYHSDELNFFEVRLKVLDELSFRRVQRLVFKARENMKIFTES